VTAARAARDGAPQERAAGDSAPGSDHVPAPEPLPADALDSHCHLDLIDQPAGAVIAAAQAAGIRRMITVGVDLPSSRWSAECAAGFEGLYAAVAIHPNETAAAASLPGGRDAVLAEISELAAQPQVRAVGETGLDYYRDHASPEVQQDWFRAHIAIAKRAGKALVIHDRDAHQDVLRILDEEGPPEKVVFHCFSGDAAMAKRCAEAGYLMSFAGNLTFKNAQPLRDAAAAAPADLLLVETDAPFLTPVPNRGKPNSPAMAAHTLRCLAEVKQIDAARLCALVTAAGERAFGPW
jgi:TatD DNase family protein